MSQFLETETLIIELLLIVSIVAIVVRRFQIPYTVALVVAGLLITFQSPIKFELTPELILTLFVPPLVFEAAFHINLRELQKALPVIILLAVPGVILSMLITASFLIVGLKMSLTVALLFGALISATDPVAVVALFRTLGVPKRLAVIVEGESLLNDGTAIVLFSLMLAAIQVNQLDLLASGANFIRVAGGGLLIGFAAGWVVSKLISQIDDYLIEITLTTILAFGSYLLADKLQLSGVLAVVAAGLVNGNLGSQGMSPTTRIVLFNFWEYIAFLTNSLVFLLIGLQVNFPALLVNWQFILWAILGILAGRVVVVYGFGWLARRLSGPLPPGWLHVINWGGLRGAICLALALTLPSSLGPDRERLQAMTFGVVLFTLLLQSTTMRWLIGRLKIIMLSQAQIEYETRHARLTALYAADARLDGLRQDGLVSKHTWEKLKQSIAQQAARLSGAVRELLLSDPALEAKELEIGWRELNRAQRGSYLSLRRDGVISDEVFETLTAEVDARLSDESPAINAAGPAPVQFIEITIPKDSAVLSKTVAEMDIPRSALLVSIHRGSETIIPRGSSLFLPGDVLTILCENEGVGALYALFNQQNPGE